MLISSSGPITLGDEGNGYYSAAYNIYSIMLILSSYSLPVAVSKMVSARLARGSTGMSERSCGPLYFLRNHCGEALDSVLYGLAPAFLRSMIKMPYSAYALKVLAPTVWVMAYLGGPQRIFPGTFHHGTNGCFPDFLNRSSMR